VPKKKPSSNVERLASALEKKERKLITNPKGGPEAYRFKPGSSGNPAGRPPQAASIVRQITERMARSSPPRELCEELGIDPCVTWGEAVLIVLGQAAMSGDVSAAREVLAALGMSGTSARTNVLVNVEGAEQRGLNFELLRHSHGLSEEDMRGKVFPFLDSLNRQKPVIDSSYFPDAEYCDGEAGPLLDENSQLEKQ
jgi:hypothetical protein